MKLLGVISTTVLALALAAAVPAYAQQDQHDQKQEEKANPARQGEKQTQQHNSAKQEQKPAPQQEKAANQQKPSPQREKIGKQQQRTAQQRQRPTGQVRPAEQAKGGGAGRIPEARYRAKFGQEHRFHVSQSDYRGHRFQYGGYSFGFVDPWPANWLYSQDVYVVEINGMYFLCNPMYPGVNVALSVNL